MFEIHSQALSTVRMQKQITSKRRKNHNRKIQKWKYDLIVENSSKEATQAQQGIRMWQHKDWWFAATVRS